MHYAEYPPVARLAPFVRCVWTLEGAAAGSVSPVLPDGRPELILHLGDPFDVVGEDGKEHRQPPAVFAGQLTERLLMRPRGRSAVVGVRFHPHGAAALIAQPLSELAGVPIDAGAVDATLAGALRSVRSATSDPATAAALVQRALVTRVDGARIDPRVRFAVDRIERAQGCLSMARVADAAGVTPRHLERLFLRHVGVGPKRLARISRFQRALMLLERGEGRGADTAADCGYADQAHFVRDFRLLAGCSPSSHLLSEAELTGFFVRRVLPAR
jgi:AraC-like DNA-binding protein